MNHSIGGTMSSTADTAVEVQMFWAYGPLSRLEILCINSFLKNQYDVNVWSYGGAENIPSGASLRDARHILPEERVFKYENGSYAGFANLFRYKLLCSEGGLWADTDVVCLRSRQSLPRFPFLVSQRSPKGNPEINNNVMFHPDPAKGDIVDLAHAITDRFDVKRLRWGDCGPRLLTSLVTAYKHISPKILEPDFANPIDYFHCPDELLRPDVQLDEKSHFLHAYNEMWRRSSVDKSGPFPEGSIMRSLEVMYLS